MSLLALVQMWYMYKAYLATAVCTVDTHLKMWKAMLAENTVSG